MRKGENEKRKGADSVQHFAGNSGLQKRSALIEVYAHPIFGTPDDGTRQIQVIAGYNEREFRGNTVPAGYFQQGAGGRQVANGAIDGHAAKLDGCGFQDAVTNCNPCFDHPIQI
jgi:hypothetical protein